MQAGMHTLKVCSSHTTIQIALCFIIPNRNQTLIRITDTHFKTKNSSLYNHRDSIKFYKVLVRSIQAGHPLAKGQALAQRYSPRHPNVKRYQFLQPPRLWHLSRYRSLRSLSNLWLLDLYFSSHQSCLRLERPSHIINIQQKKFL